MAAGAVAAVFSMWVSWSVATAAPPAGNSPGPLAGPPTVSGTVSLEAMRLRETVSLPAMAMVHVELLDLSTRDPGAAMLGKDSIWIAAGKLPVSFRIAYDPSRVDPTHVYVVRARITEKEKLLFLSATPYYVLTRGARDKVDITVIPAPAR